MTNLFRNLLILSVALLAVGCGESGPELGTVSGLVTMDSTPLSNVVVTFVPEKGGRAATGTTDASGKYKLIFLDRDGALIGKHKVSVTTLPKTAVVKEMSSNDPEYLKQMLSTESANATAPFVEPIPAKYNTRTELVKEVAAGNNEINLELASK